MENDKKDDRTATSIKQGTQSGRTPSGRPDLNEINRRNAEEEKKERRTSYNVAGIMALFVIIVIALVYFLT